MLIISVVISKIPLTLIHPLCFLPSVDHLGLRVGAHTELHRPGPLVRHLPSSDVQEHGQEGSQEHRHHMDCVVCHHDPPSHRDGVQQPAARADKQDEAVHRVRRALGRLVST